MKLTRKLSLAIGLGICLVLSVHAALRIGSDRRTYRADVVRDHAAIGKSLGSVVEMLWARDGATRALDAVDHLNQRTSHITIRWVWARPGTESEYAPRLAPLVPRRGTAPRWTVTDGDDGVPHLLTYVPVRVPDDRRGAIELYESLEGERLFHQKSLTRTATTTGVLVLVCLALTIGFGVVFVARPMRLLVAKAERIGLGDLEGPLVLRQDDEVRDLAEAMNVMCDRLRESRAREQVAAAERLHVLEQLRHVDRLATIGQLASGIAHELGTPLNVVRVRGAMIASGEVSADRTRELGQVVVDQADKMAVIIRRLLDYARKSAAQRSDVDLVRLTAEVVRMLGPTANARNVSLSHATAEASLICRVDPLQVEQALTNLVVNGIQACQAGGSVTVRIARDSSGDRPIRIEIRDDGEGIPPEDLARVLDPFFTTKRPGEGTGLGLPIAHGIVKELGGELELASERGVGTIARVRLPCESESLG